MVRLVKYGVPLGHDGRNQYYRLDMVVRESEDGSLEYVCRSAEWATTEEARVAALRAQDQIDALTQDIQQLRDQIAAARGAP